MNSNNKSNNIIKCDKSLMKNHNGKFSMDLNKLIELLLIGEKIDDCVLLFTVSPSTLQSFQL